MDNLQKETNGTPIVKDNSQKAPDDVSPEVKLRHEQQMEGSKKEVQKYHDLAIDSEVKRAEMDSNSIIELHSKDPKLANEVAKKFWYTDFEDAKSSIEEKSEDISQQTEEEKFNEWYKKARVKEESSNAYSEADKIFSKLDESKKLEAEKNYKMMTDGRNLTVDQATEMAKMATLYASKDEIKNEKFTEGLIWLGSNGLWISQSVKPESNPENKKFWEKAFWGQFAHLYK